MDGRQISAGGDRRAGGRQSKADHDALQGDGPRAPRDREGRQKRIQADDYIRRLGRSGRPRKAAVRRCGRLMFVFVAIALFVAGLWEVSAVMVIR